MTAPVPNRQSPMAEVKKGLMSIGSFSMDQNFLQNQTVKVYVRLKPSLDEDEEEGKPQKDDKKVWDIKKLGASDAIVERGVLRKVEGKSSFNIDQVFDESAQTPLLYKSIARSMVHSVLGGKNATLFAYGQTGAGKTYTMQGDGKAQRGQAGIIQLVVGDIFRSSRLGEQSSRNFAITVSYVEVYNERVRDLLSDEAGDNSSQGSLEGTPVLLNDSEVQIRTDPDGGISLNCVTKQIYTVEDALELLVLGNSNRVVAKTDANNHSSRSHAIFRINVQSTSKDIGRGGDILRLADFNLVDLAGSEGASAVGTNAKRQKEGSKINQSLLALSNVMNDLSLPEKKRPKQINYKDSKLTQILQPHLSGNAELAIVLCACPTKSFLEETRSTFRFGSKAKLVTVKPLVNELNDDTALIKKLQAELELAKQQLEEYKREGVPEEDRIDAPKTAAGSKSAALSVDSQDTGSINYDEVSLGYDDMDQGPGHREFEFVSNQEAPPPKNWEEGEKIPGMGGREYVMPKNMQGLPPELQEAQLAKPDDDDPLVPAPPSNYVMPKDHALNDVPTDLGGDFGDKDGGDEAGSEVDIMSTDDDMNNSAHFDMDMMVDPEEAKAARNYLRNTKDIADTNSSTHGSAHSSGYGSGSAGHQSGGTGTSRQYKVKAGSRLDQTGPTEDDTYDGPERSFAGMSEKFGSVMSKPETLRAASAGGARSKQGTITTFDNFHDRHGNQVSWDTMDLDTMQPEQAGKPLKAIQSLYYKEAPIPDEITILKLSVPEDDFDDVCLTDKLLDAEARSNFMQNRLEMADDLVEGIFKDLERARLCIHDLVYRNAQLSAKLKEKRREDIKEEYQEKEVVVEQYWMLKGAMYVGLFFFISGGYEFFMASVFLVWLILEVNLGSTT